MSDLRLMCIFAHPDDEALGCGFTLAKVASEGVQITLVCATRGERGWQGVPEVFPGEVAFGKIREAELLEASKVLGIREVVFLDYLDGDLSRVNTLEAVGKIAREIRRVRPQVVVTFDPSGAYGHPDHIAISQYSLGGVMAAADIGYIDSAGFPPHRVEKVYYMVDTAELVQMVKETIGPISIEVGGVVREHFGWPGWAVTTWINAVDHWETGLKAIACHQTQVSGILDRLYRLPETHDPGVWANQAFYRVFSLVPVEGHLETDLFEGLR